MTTLSAESGLWIKSREFAYNHPNLVRKFGAGILALAIILPAAGCGADEKGPTANPDTTSVAESDNEPLENESTAEPHNSKEIDLSITKIESLEEASTLIENINKGISRENVSRHELIVDASGINGEEYQQNAVDIMANDLFITPKEIEIWTKINLELTKQIAPLMPSVEAEEQVNPTGATVTAIDHYNLTRAWAYITGSINNQIAKDKIMYPLANNDCSLDEDIYNYFETSNGKIAQSVVSPSVGMLNTVSFETFNCTNQEKVVKQFKKVGVGIYDLNEEYAYSENKFAQAEAYEILISPIKSNNKEINKLVDQLKN